jgi:hypothetical protein
MMIESTQGIVGGTDLSMSIDYIEDADENEYIEDILGSAAWLRALLCGRFVYPGLCDCCHAVFQIGVGYGLLFAVLSDVKSVDLEGHRSGRAQQIRRNLRMPRSGCGTRSVTEPLAGIVLFQDG